MSTTTIFERIVTGDDVEQWVMTLVHRWIGTYLSEVERQHGVEAGTLQRPRGWSIGPTADKFPEDQVPCVILISRGWARNPRMDGAGHYAAFFDMALGVVCSARTEKETRLMAMWYTAALATLLAQRQSLDGNADGTEVIIADWTELPYDDQRSLALAVVGFVVQVENSFSSRAGPLTPDDPLDPDTLPWPPWQDVQEYEITVDNVKEIP